MSQSRMDSTLLLDSDRDKSQLHATSCDVPPQRDGPTRLGAFLEPSRDVALPVAPIAPELDMRDRARARRLPNPTHRDVEELGDFERVEQAIARHAPPIHSSTACSVIGGMHCSQRTVPTFDRQCRTAPCTGHSGVGGSSSSRRPGRPDNACESRMARSFPCPYAFVDMYRTISAGAGRKSSAPGSGEPMVSFMPRSSLVVRFTR